MLRQIYIGKTDDRKHNTCIKIGISKDSVLRWRQIDNSIEGSKEWAICSYVVLFAAGLEKILHQRYKQYRIKFKGSGKTEWFRMPVLKRWEAILIMFVWSVCSILFLIVAVISIAVVLHDMS